MRGTDEIGSGSLLATATATANQLAPSMQKHKGCREIQLLPTPAAQSYGSNQGGAAGRVGPVRPSLETMARHNLWPTPRSADADKGRRTPEGAAKDLARKPGPDLVTMVMVNTPRTTPRSARELDGVSPLGNGGLNPTWVEWLMGFPSGWTALEPSATPSSRKSSKKSGGQS